MPGIKDRVRTALDALLTIHVQLAAKLAGAAPQPSGFSARVLPFRAGLG